VKNHGLPGVIPVVITYPLHQGYSGARAERGKRGPWDVNEGIHLENLKQLRRSTTDYAVDKKLCIATVNTRSIRNKSDEFLHHVVVNDYDICAVTETWLMQNDAKCRADLNQCGYTFWDVERKDRRGGGTGIMFKKELNIAKTQADMATSSPTSFEFSEWKLLDKTFHTTIVIIYRPLILQLALFPSVHS
jgi:hypothetical protein